MSDSLEQTNASNAAPPCQCISWAREADDTMRVHHPRCPEGNPIAHYVSILQTRNNVTREALLQMFIQKHFPTAYELLTGTSASF